MVVMDDLVVPGRAGAVPAGVVSAHRLVAGEPVGVVVDAPQAAGGAAGRLAVRPDAVGFGALRQLANIRRDVDQHPVVEVGPWQIGWDGHPLLVDVIGLRRHVRVMAEDGKGAGAFRRARPADRGAQVPAHGAVRLRVGDAERVLLGNRRAVRPGVDRHLQISAHLPLHHCPSDSADDQSFGAPTVAYSAVVLPVRTERWGAWNEIALLCGRDARPHIRSGPATGKGAGE